MNIKVFSHFISFEKNKILYIKLCIERMSNKWINQPPIWAISSLFKLFIYVFLWKGSDNCLAVKQILCDNMCSWLNSASSAINDLNLMCHSELKCSVVRVTCAVCDTFCSTRRVCGFVWRIFNCTVKIYVIIMRKRFLYITQTKFYINLT